LGERRRAVSETVKGTGELHYPDGEIWGLVEYELTPEPGPGGRVRAAGPTDSQLPFLELCGSSESYLHLEQALEGGHEWLSLQFLDPEGGVSVLGSLASHPKG
jgi:hypothetical protein